jgi:phage terminase large subunit-like protein
MFTPTRFTPALKEDFKADIDRFLPLLEDAWRQSMGYWLDDWQVELIRRITELREDGTLRWRQCLVSVSRQSGKTELTSLLGVWSLLRDRDQYNVGVASQVDQARILYERIQRIINGTPHLKQLMTKLTDTRGIRTAFGSRYEIKAAKASTLQGFPISVGVVDEVHLVDDASWSALVAGQGARKSSIIIGITTAGDQNSALLKRLYAAAEDAIEGKSSRFGAWIWEADESVVPEDDAHLLKLLTQANPALQCGRLDGEILLEDVRSTPDEDVIRYRLNRFVHSNQNSFIPLSLWWSCERGPDETLPPGKLFFCVDKTRDNEFATIAAAVLVDDVVHTEVIATFARPTISKLMNVCQQLMKHNPVGFVMDGLYMKDLAKELELRSIPVEVYNQGHVIRGSMLLFSRLKHKTVKHAGDKILTYQIPRTVRKNVGDTYRVSRIDSSVEIDAVMATVLAVYAASEQTPQHTGLQLFVGG